MKITVKRLGDQIGLEFSMPDGQMVTVELPPDEAQRVGLALIGRAEPESSGHLLLAEAPLLATWNPRMEIQASDAGQILIAYQANQLRPLLIQLEKDRARELRDALNNFLG